MCMHARACASHETACVYLGYSVHVHGASAPSHTHVRSDATCKCMAHAGALIWSKSAAGRNARAARPASGGFRPATPLRSACQKRHYSLASYLGLS